ncbi:hypothetical protein FHR37_002902 [Actinopolymorpha cephalotaxi]|uniref:Uncharacterized protein n=1 Tax=Actinopolymorpha cephalotaxi TaxID=504797 RepID=A0ABX2S348_9ACTN|nr:hypothetical protein [Actinopolymorpha cephalotaxi]
MADFTYVPLISGFVYTAFVVDAFAGVIGGWKSQRPSGPRSSNGPSPRPARRGEWQGNPSENKAIHHSDAGRRTPDAGRRTPDFRG